MNRSASVFIAFLLVTFLIAPFTEATQVIYMDPQRLGQQSELVIHGTVVDVTSYWNDKRTKIFTTTRVSVQETFKGSGPAIVEVIQLGGTVGPVRVTVSGALQWKPGEEVLLFVEPSTEGRYQVSGFSQGKFNVKRDPKTGAPFVERPELEGVQIMGAPSVDGLPAPSKINKVPLSVFVNQALGRR